MSVLFDVNNPDPWRGSGRTVLMRDNPDRGYSQFGMHVTVGDWVISCQWGTGTYSTAGRAEDGFSWPMKGTGRRFSPDAEVAFWNKADDDEGLREFPDGDTVQGWVKPEAVLRALEAADRNDGDGIRLALSTSDESE